MNPKFISVSLVIAIFCYAAQASIIDDMAALIAKDLGNNQLPHAKSKAAVVKTAPAPPSTKSAELSEEKSQMDISEMEKVDIDAYNYLHHKKEGNKDAAEKSAAEKSAAEKSAAEKTVVAAEKEGGDLWQGWLNAQGGLKDKRSGLSIMNLFKDIFQAMVQQILTYVTEALAELSKKILVSEKLLTSNQPRSHHA